MASYTSWPAPADLLKIMATSGIALRADADTPYLQSLIDAASTMFEKMTHHQYVVGSPGEIRFFDGSGTGEQPVDDIITLTDVSILGYLGVAGGSLTGCYIPVQTQYPNNRILIYQGSLPAIGRVWLDSFPAGRRNIQVTGTWGYGATIPADVWEAVRRQAGSWAAVEGMFDSKGRISKWMELDTLENRQLSVAGEEMGWIRQFRQTVYQYRRPLQELLNRSGRRMI